MAEVEASESNARPTAVAKAPSVASNPESDQSADADYITAVITVLAHDIVYGLPDRAFRDNYPSDKLKKIHLKIKQDDKEPLFAHDENWRDLKPKTIIAWVRLFGLDDGHDNHHKFLKFNKTGHKIKKEHIDRMQAVLKRLVIIPKPDVETPLYDDTKSSWIPFLCYVYEAITGNSAAPVMERVPRSGSKAVDTAPASARPGLAAGDDFTDADKLKKLKTCLEPVNQDADIAVLIDRFVGRGWLLDRLEEWRKTALDSHLLWISGEAGTGKSAFAAWLAYHGNVNVLGLNLCAYNKNDRCDAGRVIRTLAFQIATHLPDYRDLLLDRLRMHDWAGSNALDGKSSAESFASLLVEPLRRVIDGERRRDRCLIVIDGLDETIREGRSDLAEVLAAEAHKLPSWIAFVVTSRPVQAIWRQFASFKPVLLAADSPKIGTISAVISGLGLPFCLRSELMLRPALLASSWHRRGISFMCARSGTP